MEDSDVWDAVLKQLIKAGQFKMSDLSFDEGKRHTVRRVLREMDEMGWLERDDERSTTWKPGRFAEMHLGVGNDQTS